MTQLASGTFEVKVTPQAPEANAGDASIGRMALDKIFSGDLDASSKGQMLAMRTAVDGSAGYVAMECVSGALHGRRGTFALQHSGSMAHGAQSLSISVVPDSATGELAGLSGTLAIKIIDGQHHYAFDYLLSEKSPPDAD
jgi:hypothetical protein